MMTQSGMYEDDGTLSYSKKPKNPDPQSTTSTGISSEKLYVGHLPFQVSKRDLDELFGPFGTLANIEIKHGGYAFIQYENVSHAEAAVASLNGFTLEGRRLTVEFSNKKGTGGNSCLLCGKDGHWARECPENKEKGMDVKSGKCFKCGDFGHLARFCRGYGTQPPERFERRQRSPRRKPYQQREPYRNRSPEYSGYRRSYDSYYHPSRYSPPPYERYDYGYHYDPYYRMEERDHYPRERYYEPRDGYSRGRETERDFESPREPAVYDDVPRDYDERIPRDPREPLEPREYDSGTGRYNERRPPPSAYYDEQRSGPANGYVKR